MTDVRVNQKTGEIAVPLPDGQYKVFGPTEYKWNRKTGEYAVPHDSGWEVLNPVTDTGQKKRTHAGRGGYVDTPIYSQDQITPPPIGVDANGDQKPDVFMDRGNYSSGQSFGLGFADWFPWADEATAAVLAVPHAREAGGYGKAYDAIQPVLEQRYAEASRQHPGAYMGGSLVGGLGAGVAAPTLTGGKYIAAAQTPLQVINRSAQVGGVMGAAYGSGNAEPGGRIEGGATGAAKGAAASAAIPAIGYGARAGKDIVQSLAQPFTSKGQDAIVANTLNRLAGPDDLSAALAQNTDLVPGSVPTTGQATGNYGLLSAENALAADPAIGGALANRGAANNAARSAFLDQLAPQGVGAANVRDAVQRELQRFGNATNEMIDAATARAAQAFQSVGGQIDPQDAGRIIRQAAQEAYDAQRGNVRQAYGAIDPSGNTQINLAPVYDQIAPDVNQAFAVRTGGTPPQLLDIMARLRNTSDTNVRAVDTIRQELQNIASQAARAGDNQLASQAGNIARSIDDHMGAIASGTAQGGLSPQQIEQLRLARTMRSNQGELYESGAMGNVLDRPDYGRYGVPDSKVAPTLLGGSPEATQQVIGATAGNQTAANATRDFLATSYRSSAMRPDGSIDANAAQRWLDKNQSMLRQFPDFADAAQAAVEAQRRALGLTERQTQAMQQIERGPLGRLLGDKNPDQAIQSIISGSSSAADTARLLRTIQNDPNAVAGLKRSVVDFIAKASQGGQVNIAGDVNITAKAFGGAMEKLKPVLDKLFTQSERTALENLGKDLTRGSLNQAARGVGSNTVQNLTVSNLIDRVLRGAVSPDNPVAQSLLRPLGFAYKVPEQQIREKLGNALLTPSVAQGLLGLAPKSPAGRGILSLSAVGAPAISGLLGIGGAF